MRVECSLALLKVEQLERHPERPSQQEAFELKAVRKTVKYAKDQKKP